MRVRIALLLSLLTILITPAEAFAGGWWSYLQIPGRYLGVGETITFTENEVMFQTIEEAEGASSEAFGVYLVQSYDERLLEDSMTRAEPDDWWKPLSAPMRVGDLALIDRDSNLMKARVNFTVPEIPPGRYALVLCSIPDCARTLGNVIPAEVIVTEDALLAKTARRVANESFENEMALVRMRHRLSDVHKDLVVLRKELAEPAPVAAPTTPAPRRESGTPWIAYAGWFMAGGAAAAAVVRKRRSVRSPGGFGLEQLTYGPPTEVILGSDVHGDDISVADFERHPRATL